MNLMEKYRAKLGDTGGRTPNSSLPLPELREISMAKLKEPLPTKWAEFERFFNQGLEEINWQYEPGTIPYIRENHSALWQKMVESENRLCGLWLEGKPEAFKLSLDEWLNLNLRAIRTFRARGTQKTIFDLD